MSKLGPRFTRRLLATAGALCLSLSVGATVAGTASATVPSTCSPYPTAVCIYQNSGYSSSGAVGKLYGNNSSFTTLGKSTGGTWNDVVSSAFNYGGGSYNVALWQNSNYAAGGGFDECLSPGVGNSNFSNISTGIYPWDNFDNEASSNQWFPVGSSYTCHHFN